MRSRSFLSFYSPACAFYLPPNFFLSQYLPPCLHTDASKIYILPTPVKLSRVTFLQYLIPPLFLSTYCNFLPRFPLTFRTGPFGSFGGRPPPFWTDFAFCQVISFFPRTPISFSTLYLDQNEAIDLIYPTPPLSSCRDCRWGSLSRQQVYAVPFSSRGFWRRALHLQLSASSPMTVKRDMRG